jgi:hypothetical protein
LAATVNVAKPPAHRTNGKVAELGGDPGIPVKACLRSSGAFKNEHGDREGA